MSIKVLQVYKTANPYTFGGVETVIAELCRNMAAEEVEITVVCLQTESAEIQQRHVDGIRIIAFPQTIEISSCGFSLKLLTRFKALVEAADIIHFHHPWPFADLLALLYAKNTPYIVTYHSDIVRQKKLMYLYGPLMHRYLKRAAAIVVTSPQYAVSSEILQKYRDKLNVIPNGISTTQPEVNLVTAEHKTDPFFLFVGAFRYYKGIRYLLDAAKQSGVNVVIVGDGPEREEIEHWISRHHADNITLVGQVSEQQKFELLSQCMALVLPSCERSEAFGMVLLEAARQAKAMISTQLGSGTSFINLDGETGYVVAPHDAEALAEAMLKMKSAPEMTQQMGQAAYKRFIDLFNIETLSAHYIELYKEALH